MRWMVLALVACGGCTGQSATGATSGRRATLPMMSFRAHDKVAVDHEGVGLVAGIVTWDTARRYKDAMVVAHWLESNERMPTARNGSVGRVGPTAERWGEIPVMPMPTFMLGIANRTDHVVKVSPSQLELVDGAGARYAAFPDLGSIEGRVEEQLVGTYRGLMGAQSVRDGLHTKLGQLAMLTKPVEVAPGADWVGFVAFQLPVQSPSDYSKYAERVGRLEVRFTDEHGTAVLAFDKVAGTLAVTCPDDEQATIERCPPGGAMPRPSPQGT